MSQDNFNMAMRKFLKQVGVTSQQELERARAKMPADAQEMNVKMVLTIDGLEFEHAVEGSITLAD